MSKVTPQSDATVVAQLDMQELSAGKDGVRSLDDFESGLRDLGDQVQKEMVRDGGCQPFEDLNELHFLSVCVVSQQGSGDRTGLGRKHCVVLELGFDGKRQDFLERLVAERMDLLETVFRFCVGYTDGLSGARMVAWLQSRLLPSATFYCSHRGRSRDRIRSEMKLYEEVRRFALETRPEVASRRDLWGRVQERYREDERWQELGRAGSKLPWRIALGRPEVWKKWLYRLMLVFVYLIWAAGLWQFLTLLASDIGVLRGGGDLRFWTAVRLAVMIPLPIYIVLRCVGLWFKESPSGLSPQSRSRVYGQILLRGAFLAVNTVAIIGALFGIFFFWPWELWFLLSLATLILALAVYLAANVLATFSPLQGSLLVVPYVLIAIVIVLYPVGVLTNPALEPDALRYVKMWGPSVALIFLMPLALIAARLIAVRNAERLDREAPTTMRQERIDRLRRREHQQTHTHFAAYGELKVGPKHEPAAGLRERLLRPISSSVKLRVHTLRAIFRAINFLHRVYYNQGWLANLSTIHFARWSIHDEKWMLFLTNYDDSFEAYLGEFSRNVGTTAVFGHFKGFPRPYYLVWDGARGEQQFKAFARTLQVESLIWYSAYPEIRVQDVVLATRVRRALERSAEPRRGRLFASAATAVKWPMSELEILQVLDRDLALKGGGAP